MVRETRHLWVGNLPETVREDRIREHFKRYGRVQSVKILTPATKQQKLGDSVVVAATGSPNHHSSSSTNSTIDYGGGKDSDRGGGGGSGGVGANASSSCRNVGVVDHSSKINMSTAGGTGTTTAVSNRASVSNNSSGDSCQTTTVSAFVAGAATTTTHIAATSNSSTNVNCNTNSSTPNINNNNSSSVSNNNEPATTVNSVSISSLHSNNNASVNRAPNNISNEGVNTSSINGLYGGGSVCATVAFMDIKSASKAHTAEHKFDDRILTTEYYEPSSIPSSTLICFNNNNYVSSGGGNSNSSTSSCASSVTSNIQTGGVQQQSQQQSFNKMSSSSLLNNSGNNISCGPISHVAAATASVQLAVSVSNPILGVSSTVTSSPHPQQQQHHNLHHPQHQSQQQQQKQYSSVGPSLMARLPSNINNSSNSVNVNTNHSNNHNHSVPLSTTASSNHQQAVQQQGTLLGASSAGQQPSGNGPVCDEYEKAGSPCIYGNDRRLSSSSSSNNENVTGAVVDHHFMPRRQSMTSYGGNSVNNGGNGNGTNSNFTVGGGNGRRERLYSRNSSYSAALDRTNSSNPHHNQHMHHHHGNHVHHHMQHHRGGAVPWYENNIPSNVNSSLGSIAGGNRAPSIGPAANERPTTPSEGSMAIRRSNSLEHAGGGGVMTERRNSETSDLLNSNSHMKISSHEPYRKDIGFVRSSRSKMRAGSESPPLSSHRNNSSEGGSSRGNIPLRGDSVSSRSHSRSPSSCSSSNSMSSNSGGNRSSSSPRNNCSNADGHGQQGQMAGQIQAASRSNRLSSGGNSTGHMSTSSQTGPSSATPGSNCTTTNPEDNRPLAIRVRNLPIRSSDTSLKDGLFHEYKKHGKVTSVKVVGQNSERYALVCFKKTDDVEKALEVSRNKLFFGCKIEVEPYAGYDVEDNEFRPYEAELDEYHPKSTRTLFIGNLEKDISSSELRKHFDCFGEIIDIDIKKQGTSAYAFCQYSDIVSVVKAMRKMDGEHLGNNRIKLGFGKSMPTSCVWMDGIAESVSDHYLTNQFNRFGPVVQVVIDKDRHLALVFFDQVQYAQTAVKEMRGVSIRGRKLQVDFASRECQDAFYEKLDKQVIGERTNGTIVRESRGSGNFEGTMVSGRGGFGRYDNQSRSRTSSFSRHAGGTASGCNSGTTSPTSGIMSDRGGATTPRGTGRMRTTRFLSNTEYFTEGGGGGSAGSDYLDRRNFRSYDEYSQGSAASHEEIYDSTQPGAGENFNFPAGSNEGPGMRLNRSSSGERGESERRMLGCDSPPQIISSRLEPDLSLAGARRKNEKSPGDIRHLKKERVHLLEQLKECPSSGDELVSPKKRIRYDPTLVDNTLSFSTVQNVNNSILNCDSNCDSSVVNHNFESNPMHSASSSSSVSLQQHHHHHHQSSSVSSAMALNAVHRKVEVRRLSESSQKLIQTGVPTTTNHISISSYNRRPSTESGANRERYASVSNSEHHMSANFQPSSVCKRRRTGDSVSGTMGPDHHMRGRGHLMNLHHSHETSGGESADGSRPGTPLCDERPENLIPTEPRRIPRDLRPHEPMVLPLPKFAIQFYQQQRLLKQQQENHHHSNLMATPTMPTALLSHSAINYHSSTSSPNSVRSSSPRHNHHHGGHHHHLHYHHGLGGIQSKSSGLSSEASFPPPPPSPTLDPTVGTQNNSPTHRETSISSNSSSDSEMGSVRASPCFDERIKSLDEMLEKLNPKHPLRSLSSSSTQHLIQTPLALENRDQALGVSNSSSFLRHNFLDVKEVQPSDILKSVLAKKSIFDEDSKRLENIGDKYEPSDYLNYTRLGVTASTVTSTTVNTLSSSSSLSSLPNLATLTATPAPLMKGPSTPISTTINRLTSSTTATPLHSPQLTPSQVNSSPNSNQGSQSATAVTPVKGLQYPFPSHPPAPITQPPPMPPLPPLPSGPAAANPALPPPITTSTTTSVTNTTSSIKQVPILKSVSLQESSINSKPITVPNKPITKSLSVPNSSTVNKKLSEEKEETEIKNPEDNTLVSHQKLDKIKSLPAKIEKPNKMPTTPITTGLTKERKTLPKESGERRKSISVTEEKDSDEKHTKKRCHKDGQEDGYHREHKKHEDVNLDKSELFDVIDEIKRTVKSATNSRASSPNRSHNKRRIEGQENPDFEEMKKSKVLSEPKNKNKEGKSHESSKHKHKLPSDRHHKSSSSSVTKSASLSEEVKQEDKFNPTESQERIRSASVDDVPKTVEGFKKKDSSVPADNKPKSKSVEHKMDLNNDDSNCYDRDFIENMEQQNIQSIRSSDDEHQIHMSKLKSKKEKKRDKYKLEQNHEYGSDEMRQRDEDHKKSGDRKSTEKLMSYSTNRNDEGSVKSSSSSDNGRKSNKISNRKNSCTFSTDSDDSDEPKKHSIFDIPEEGPYVSMYDKVKARSCKNMQKQEEEKKIKAKFSQLKQSRAKREGKKHSNSWDGDTDSDDDEHDHSFSKLRNATSSDHSDDMDDEEMDRKRSHSKHHSNINRESSLFDSDTGASDRMRYRVNKLNELCDEEDSSDTSTVMSKSRKKITSRKNSRSTRIASDSSDEEEISLIRERYDREDVKPVMKEFNDKEYKIKDPEEHNLEEKPKSESVDIKTEIKMEVEDSIPGTSIFDEPIPRKTEQVVQIKKEHKEEIKAPPPTTLYDISSDEPDHGIPIPHRNISAEVNQKQDYFESESKRKHKKKQKKQKSSTPTTPKTVLSTSDYTSETGDKESTHKDSEECVSKSFGRSVDLFDELKKESNAGVVDYINKKKHSSRKDRKKSNKDEYENRENRLSKEDRNKMKKKNRKSFESSYEMHQSDFSMMKRGEKMEEIFGPLSDDDTNASFPEANSALKSEPPSNVLSSSSNILAKHGEVVKANIPEPKKMDNKEAFFGKIETSLDFSDKEHKSKEDMRKQKKDKKKKDKDRSKVTPAKDDDNSVDLDEAGRALEAELMNVFELKTEEQQPKFESISTPSTAVSYISNREMSDVFRFTDGDDSAENNIGHKEKSSHGSKDEHRQKDKKKKKKRSKEEKLQRREHHQKSDSKLESDLKSAPSLPSLLDDSPPPLPTSEGAEAIKIAASTKTPIEAKKKLEKFIPGFGAELDENLSESAVKSISVELDTKPILGIKSKSVRDEPTVESELDKSVDDKSLDEKSSRVVISQEETEDAVAALLGESFASSNVTDYSDCYAPVSIYDEPSPPASGDPMIPEEEAEEMRKAVQSLHATDMDVKPETPQSENDLQIDTDAEQDDPESATAVTKIETEQPKQTPLEQPQSVSKVVKAEEPKPANEEKIIIKEDTSKSPVKPSLPTVSQPSVITKTTPKGQIKITELVSCNVPTKPIIVENKQHQLKTPVTVSSHMKPLPKPEPIISTIPTTSQSTVCDFDRLLVKTPTSGPAIRPPTIINSPRHPQPQQFQIPVSSQSIIPKSPQPPQTVQHQSPVQFVSHPQHQSPQKMPVQTSPRPIGPYGVQPPTINIPDHGMFHINVKSPRGTPITDVRMTSPRIHQQQFVKASSPQSPTTTPPIRANSRHSPQLSPAAIQQQILHQQQRQLLSPTNQSQQILIRNVPPGSQPQSPIQTVLRVVQQQQPMQTPPGMQLAQKPNPNLGPAPMPPKPLPSPQHQINKTVIESLSPKIQTQPQQVPPGLVKPIVSQPQQQYKQSPVIQTVPSSPQNPADNRPAPTIIVHQQQMPHPTPNVDQTVKKEVEKTTSVETPVSLPDNSLTKPITGEVQKTESVIKMTNVMEKVPEQRDNEPKVVLEPEKPLESDTNDHDDFDEDHSEPASANLEQVVKRRGRGPGRGKKALMAESMPKPEEHSPSGVQTRRGGKGGPGRKPGRGGSRGGGRGGAAATASGSDRKARNTNSESDVYEFHDDSGEEVHSMKVSPPDGQTTQGRPRVILPTKGNQPTEPIRVPEPGIVAIQVPTIPPVNQPTSPVNQQQANIQSPINSSSESTSSKMGEDFQTPSSASSLNTRKSRRLQERDGTRTTVDDTIEDVVKNVPNSPKSSTAGQMPPRRNTRSSSSGSNSGVKNQDVFEANDLKKSPRASRKARKTSETSNDSGDDIGKVPVVIKQQESLPQLEPEKKVELPVPQTVMVENNNHKHQSGDSRTLIDPVTGELGMPRPPPPQVQVQLPTTVSSNIKPSVPIPQTITSVPASVVKTVVDATKAQSPIEKMQPPYVTQGIVSMGNPIPSSPAPVNVISQGQPVITATVSSSPITIPTHTQPQQHLGMPIRGHPLKTHVLNSQNVNKPIMISHSQNPVQHLKINADIDEYKMPKQMGSPTIARQNILTQSPQSQQPQATVVIKNQQQQQQPQQQLLQIQQPGHGHPGKLVVNLPPQMAMNMAPTSPSFQQQQGIGQQQNVVHHQQIPPFGGAASASNLTSSIQQPQPGSMQQHMIIQGNKILAHSGAHQSPMPYQNVMQGQSIQQQPPQGSIIIQQQQQQKSQVPINTQMPQHLVKQQQPPSQQLNSPVQQQQQMPHPGMKQPQQVHLSAQGLKMHQQQMSMVQQVPHGMSMQQQHMLQQAATQNQHQMHHSNMPKQQGPQPIPQQQTHVLPPNKAVVMGLHQAPQILTGAVASPPLKQPHLSSQQPIVTGASSSRVSVPHISPQGSSRHMLQAGLPVFEANLHGDIGGYMGTITRTQSPPPAHQQQVSPITPGEGTYSRGLTRDQMIVYKMIQAQARQEAMYPYHKARSPLLAGSAVETQSEMEDSMVASPPLELRRSRPSIAIPHSLQSPQDRATDSPQVAQVYVPGPRIPHPHYPEAGARYFENPRSLASEPPPAHRPHNLAGSAAVGGPPPPQMGNSGLPQGVGSSSNLSHIYSMYPSSLDREREQRDREKERETRTSIPGHSNVPSHGTLVPSLPGPTIGRNLQVTTPPHASQVPPQADSLQMLLQRYPVMWQGLLALKNDQAAVQMHFVFGNAQVADDSLPRNVDGTIPLRIAQRMRLEQTQLEGVARKMQTENEHCMLLALPCGRDHMDVLQQSTNLQTGFITYLQQKQAAGIVNIAAPGSQQAAFVVHIFPSCEFANENLARIAPDLLHRVADIAHLLIVIATV